MSDGALKYIPDTIVVSVPDSGHLPIRSRTGTDGALTMQILVMGQWHRRTPDMKTTACGVPYHSQFSPTRREELCNPLCLACFTAHELAIANVREHEGEER